jgi:putative ABC transport system ATP-binding protein
MADRQWTIETHELTRIYGSGAAEVRALDGVNLRIAPGELVTVMGPSGSGKSTLLNMIGALDLPTGGQVLVDGQDVAKIRDKDAFRSKKVGFVFQLHNLIPTLTALENVEVPMMGFMGRRGHRRRAKELLEMVGLGDRVRHLPNQLSGGERQRVAVARALANHPSLVLADEPTGSLDTEAGQELMDLIRELNRSQGTTFLIVTHDPAVARRTDRVVVMQDGKIAREDVIGSPIEEDLKMWRHSELGKHVVAGEMDALDGLVRSEQEFAVLRGVLKQANSGT